MSALSHLKHGLIIAGILFPTAAFAGHWDLPSCYIDVHSGCFVNQSQPCTDAEYKDFLRMCHDTYPASKGVGTKKKFKVQG